MNVRGIPSAPHNCPGSNIGHHVNRVIVYCFTREWGYLVNERYSVFRLFLIRDAGCLFCRRPKGTRCSRAKTGVGSARLGSATSSERSWRCLWSSGTNVKRCGKRWASRSGGTRWLGGRDSPAPLSLNPIAVSSGVMSWGLLCWLEDGISTDVQSSMGKACRLMSWKFFLECLCKNETYTLK